MLPEPTLEKLDERVEDLERKFGFLIDIFKQHFPELKEKIEYL
jgi:hypothetical protein